PSGGGNAACDGRACGAIALFDPSRWQQSGSDSTDRRDGRRLGSESNYEAIGRQSASDSTCTDATDFGQSQFECESGTPPEATCRRASPTDTTSPATGLYGPTECDALPRANASVPGRQANDGTSASHGGEACTTTAQFEHSHSHGCGPVWANEQCHVQNVFLFGPRQSA